MDKYVYGICILAGASFLLAEGMGPHGRCVGKKVCQLLKKINKSVRAHHLSTDLINKELFVYGIIGFILKCFFHIPSDMCL